MITIFNRVELFLTYDLSRFNQVRDTLEGAGLDYIYRSKDLTSPTMWEGLCGRQQPGPHRHLRYERRGLGGI